MGELVAHPVLSSLQGSGYEWLVDALAALHAGDLAKWDAVCHTHAAAMNAQPALVAKAQALKEKVTVVGLTELLFSLPSDKRTVPLSDIGRVTRLGTDGVERLLMRSVSAGLITASIDAVDGTATVTWVQPRTLLPAQIADLRAKLDGWLDKVVAARAEMEAADMVGTA